MVLQFHAELLTAHLFFVVRCHLYHIGNTSLEDRTTVLYLTEESCVDDS